MYRDRASKVRHQRAEEGALLCVKGVLTFAPCNRHHGNTSGRHVNRTGHASDKIIRTAEIAVERRAAQVCLRHHLFAEKHRACRRTLQLLAVPPRIE